MQNQPMDHQLLNKDTEIKKIVPGESINMYSLQNEDSSFDKTNVLEIIGHKFQLGVTEEQDASLHRLKKMVETERTHF